MSILLVVLVVVVIGVIAFNVYITGLSYGSEVEKKHASMKTEMSSLLRDILEEE